MRIGGSLCVGCCCGEANFAPTTENPEPGALRPLLEAAPCGVNFPECLTAPAVLVCPSLTCALRELERRLGSATVVVVVVAALAALAAVELVNKSSLVGLNRSAVGPIRVGL